MSTIYSTILCSLMCVCVRVFLKQLVLSCPQEYYDSLLCPLLGPLFAYMLQVRAHTFLLAPVKQYTKKESFFA